jgi:predicted transcriptional regulator
MSKVVSIRLADHEIEELERLADVANINRTLFVTNIVRSYLGTDSKAMSPVNEVVNNGLQELVNEAVHKAVNEVVNNGLQELVNEAVHKCLQESKQLTQSPKKLKPLASIAA